MINERIKSLRSKMKDNGISAYVIPTSDFHQSEYVGEYFKCREYISGFTGSNGLAIVTETEAHLWTDGRYFTQAKAELANSEFILEKMGYPDVPTPIEFLNQSLKDGENIGFDGRTISASAGEEYVELAESKGSNVIYNLDLVGEIWEDRPKMSIEKAFLLDEEYSGESAYSKIARVREAMIELKADTHIISSLDDICWIFNIRGRDVKYSPLLLSYSIITQDDLHLFTDSTKLGEDVKSYLSELGVKLYEYNDIYDFIKTIDEDSNVLLDPDSLNYALYENIPSFADPIRSLNPSFIFKAVKNETELKNIKEAQIKDGIAWAKFMFWIKKNIGRIKITEIDASTKLEDYRKEQENYLFPSFAPISGHGSNGAIIHYSATPETNKTLEPRGLYLSDTGANYKEGTTDITRTLALGEITEEERLHFTLVLKSHINLARAKFLEGTCGYTLDMLARQPIWEKGLNYMHGTGHGVGFLLNVHEGPSSINYGVAHNDKQNYPLMPGMMITDEPGLYIEGSHGIRTENELIVKLSEKTSFGQFLEFEVYTFVPIDLDAIDTNLLNQDEKDFLNAYHKRIFDIVSPSLEGEELEFLKEYTREI